jgi:CNT family concentrative nucleoside transporter
VAIAWLLSERKKAVSLRAIAVGLGLQLALAFVFLKIPVIKSAFLSLNSVVLALDAATTAGTSFVFGYLGGHPCPSPRRPPFRASSWPSRPCP